MFAVMTLDIEIAVLRGFLTPGEAMTWKQNTVRTAGEKLFILPPHRHVTRNRRGYFFRVGIRHTGRLGLLWLANILTQWYVDFSTSASNVINK